MIPMPKPIQFRVRRIDSYCPEMIKTIPFFMFALAMPQGFNSMERVSPGPPRVVQVHMAGRDYTQGWLGGWLTPTALSSREAAAILSKSLGKTIAFTRLEGVIHRPFAKSGEGGTVELGPCTHAMPGLVSMAPNLKNRPSVATLHFAAEKERPILIRVNVQAEQAGQFLAEVPGAKYLFLAKRPGIHSFDIVLIPDLKAHLPIRFGKPDGPWTFLGVEVWRLKSGMKKPKATA